jgi:hypothetical protein
MPAENPTTRHDITVVAGVEARPGWTLRDEAGNDWSWAYVVFGETPGFKGYSVGTDGSVWSFRSTRGGIRADPKRLKPFRHPLGYVQVDCSIGSKRTKRYVHIMVMETFIGPCPEGMEVCHNPSPDKTRNVLWNLRWGTHTENSQDRPALDGYAKGEAHHMAKTAESTVVRIRRLYKSGLKPKDIARLTGIDRGRVAVIIHGKSWKHVVV